MLGLSFICTIHLQRVLIKNKLQIKHKSAYSFNYIVNEIEKKNVYLYIHDISYI